MYTSVHKIFVLGDVKFNVEIRIWDFCDKSRCTDEEGEYLDFDIVMKGLKKIQKGNISPNEGEKYDFGSGSVILSKLVSVQKTKTTTKTNRNKNRLAFYFVSWQIKKNKSL